MLIRMNKVRRRKLSSKRPRGITSCLCEKHCHSRPVTLLNIHHPVVEDTCMTQCEEDQKYIIPNKRKR